MGTNRTRKIDVRFTEDEYALISKMEIELGLSKTNLVRMRMLNNAGKIVNAKAMIVSLDTVGAELARAGNNINQLARHANTLNLQGRLSPAIVEQFNIALEQYIGLQRSLETALRTTIRTMIE